MPAKRIKTVTANFGSGDGGRITANNNYNGPTYSLVIMVQPSLAC